MDFGLQSIVGWIQGRNCMMEVYIGRNFLTSSQPECRQKEGTIQGDILSKYIPQLHTSSNQAPLMGCTLTIQLSSKISTTEHRRLLRYIINLNNKTHKNSLNIYKSWLSRKVTGYEVRRIGIPFRIEN